MCRLTRYLPDAQSGSGSGDAVVILLLMLTFGLIATQMSRFDWNELKDNLNIDDNDFNLFGEKYSYQDQLEQAFPAGASLHVALPVEAACSSRR